MWHKNAGRENTGLENMAQAIQGWKIREKVVWKVKDKIYSIRSIIVNWHNRSKRVDILRTTL